MTPDISAGFAPQVFAAQATFRAIMDATACPASVRPIDGVAAAPAPLSSEAAAIAVALFDQDTPVWLDAKLAASADVLAWIRFHTGAPVVSSAAQAAFAILCDPVEAPPFERFCLGSDDYPDRSTTVILQVETLECGAAMSFTGPGIKNVGVLRAHPLPSDMAARLVENRARFPRGVDMLLTAPSAIAALPRSVALIEAV